MQGVTDKMEISDDDDMNNNNEDIDITMEDDNNNNNNNNHKSTQMWLEKYRPSLLSDIISHSSIISTISKLVNARKLPHLLFYGPPGTGKTTTILACARKLNGKSWQNMTLELNASDERGINVIRDRIKTFASTQQIFSTGFKLIILDEADAMTSSAQFALRRVIEKYTKNCRFCLICNYVNKIIPALQSRCTKFRFAPLDNNDIKQRLNYIVKNENINITDDGMNAILRLSKGDMRRCLNVLQSVHTGYNIVNMDNVHHSTGTPKLSQLSNIFSILLNNEYTDAFNQISLIQNENGLALNDIITGIYPILFKTKLDQKIICEVLSELADLEHRLTVSVNEKIQMASLIGIFQRARHQVFVLHDKKK